MSCSENTLLKGVKDKQKELDTLLEQGKDGLASMQSKVNELKADLLSFVPAIPEVPSLQGDLLKLGDITDAAGLTAKLAELKASMGSAVPDFDNLISGLGLDSFPPSIDSSAICSTMPNVETIDGVATVVPAESKIPEEEPAKPEPKPVIEPDKDELSLKVINHAIMLAGGQIRSKTEVLDVSGYLRDRYFELTENELYIQLSELGGSTFDDLKWRHYDFAKHQEDKAHFLNAYVYFDFTKEGQILELKYTQAKEALGPEYSDAEDLATAAKLLVDLRKENIA